MFRNLYRFLASIAGLAVRSGRSKDLEIVVLRHQLAVLGWRDTRTVITDHDRSLLGAIAQALPRPRRAGWPVTPDTVLRRQIERPAINDEGSNPARRDRIRAPQRVGGPDDRAEGPVIDDAGQGREILGLGQREEGPQLLADERRDDPCPENAADAAQPRAAFSAVGYEGAS